MGPVRALARRAGRRRRRARARRGGGRLLGGRGRSPPGRRLSLRARRPRGVAGPLLPLPARRRPRPVARGRCRRLRDRARSRASTGRARRLRAARGHLLAGGDVRRRDPAARRVARPRSHGDRADARRDVPRAARLGLRRPLHVRAAPGVRRPGGARPPRGRGPPSGPRRSLGRRLQPRRAGERGAPLLRPLFHRPLRRVALGRGARLRRAGRARVGDPERRALGARVRARRAPARRRPRGRGRLVRTCARRARAPRSRRRARRARDQRDGEGGLPAVARVGARRDVARLAPSRAPRRADRRARRLLRRLRRLDDRDRPRALASGRIAAGRLRPEPRPGRQPGARRPPAAPRSSGSRRPSFSSRRSRHSCSRARSTARRRRSSSSRTTSTRSSPTRPGRAGDASSRASRAYAADEVPDPQARSTFERSRLSPRPADELVARLLRLRRELPRELDVGFDEGARRLELRRGSTTLHVDFARETVELS